MNESVIKVAEKDKTLSAGKLFYNWFAANIGIMGFVFGTMVVNYKLSFFQAIIACFAGAMSFTISGWVAVIGQKQGITTFKLSRAPFGTKGNKVPNAIAWVNMIGWLAVNIITGTLLLVSLFQLASLEKSNFTLSVCLIVFSGLVILSGLLKEDVLAKIQTWLSWAFGIMTGLILIIFLLKANWHQALNLPKGNWITGVLPAISTVAAGSGISWSMAAADWGAYVTNKTKPGATFWSTTIGGALPLFVLMVGGVLLSTIEPKLAVSNDPFGTMYAILPVWLGPLYFLVAAGGLVPQCIISFRSARINLATIGIKLSQKTSLIVHGMIVTIIPVYVLFFADNFLTTFELFLNFLGICLASWVVIFLCDSLMFRKQGYDMRLLDPVSAYHYNWRGIISWIGATITGFMFTNNDIWNGPCARGIFRNNSLGVFVAAFVAIVMMMLWNIIDKQKRNTTSSSEVD